MVDPKRCRHCQTVKPGTDFPAMVKCRDGLSSWCRECHRAAARNYHRATYVRRVRTKMERLPAVSLGSCRRCSGSFIRSGTSGRSQRYCSPICSAKMRQPRKRVPRPRKPQAVRACVHCGTSFIGTSNRRFCSPEHGTIAHRIADRQRRRAEQVGNRGRGTKVFRLQVFERDAWICQLCRGTVDRTLIYPHPLSASLDHAVALARGGSHTYGNTQLAHLRCNSVKRAA